MKKQLLVRGTGAKHTSDHEGSVECCFSCWGQRGADVLSSWGELTTSLLRWLVNHSKVPQPSDSQTQSPPVCWCIAKTPNRKVNCEHGNQNERKKPSVPRTRALLYGGN